MGCVRLGTSSQDPKVPIGPLERSTGPIRVHRVSLPVRWVPKNVTNIVKKIDYG